MDSCCTSLPTRLSQYVWQLLTVTDLLSITAVKLVNFAVVPMLLMACRDNVIPGMP